MRIAEGFKKAYYRRIPCYFNSFTFEIEGRNWFYDILIDINLWFDFKVLNLNDLPISIEDDN